MFLTTQPVKLGLIPAHRGFFSAELAASARRQTIVAMQSAGIEVVVPGEALTNLGCVENRKDAHACAELFRRENVQGIVVGAMNFGDEQAVALTIKQSRLDVPILLF